MTETPSRPGRHFTEAARQAGQSAIAARRVEADRFGVPEVFIVKAGDRTFTWEIRRFGGLLLQRGGEPFNSQPLARVDGEKALAALCSAPDLPTFQRQRRPNDQAD